MAVLLLYFEGIDSHLNLKTISDSLQKFTIRFKASIIEYHKEAPSHCFKLQKYPIHLQETVDQIMYSRASSFSESSSEIMETI
jgi:hypothetical protein